MRKGSARGTVYGRTGGNSVRSVGLALRGRGPRASGRKVRGTNAGNGWICGGAGGWGGRRSSAIMSSSDVRGLTGVGAMSVDGSRLIPSHLSLRRLIVLEMSDPESNSDSIGVGGALGCLCASASLLIRSSSRCSLSTSSVLSGGGVERWRRSSKTLFVHNWPSRRSSVCALTPSNTSRMRSSASRSMPSALGLTVALETTDGVGDPAARGGRCVISVEVRDRYSPDEGGDCDIGVKGRVLDEGELEGDDDIEDDGGEEDMGVDEREGGCLIKGSDSIKLRSSEW